MGMILMKPTPPSHRAAVSAAEQRGYDEGYNQARTDCAAIVHRFVRKLRRKGEETMAIDIEREILGMTE